ncbi:AsmA family protein [bacterium]|nr:AsmA family protein [bacterium]
MKYLKYFGMFITGILAFSYLFFLILPPFINIDNYKSTIQTLVKDNTKLNIDYSKIKFYSTPLLSVGVIVKDLNITFDDNTTFFSADKVKGGIAIPSLLTLTVKTSKCYVDNPNINLEIVNSKQYKIVQLIEDLINESYSKANQKTEEKTVPPDIIEKIKIKIPYLKIKNYNVLVFDDDTNHTLKLQGEKLYSGFNSDTNVFYVKTISELLSDKNRNILADLNVSLELPKPEKNNEEIDPDERIKIPFINLVEIYQNYDLHANIHSKLKLRHSKNNEAMIHGFINVDDINLKLQEIRLPDSFFHIKFAGGHIKFESNIYAKDDEKLILEGNLKQGKNPRLIAQIKSDEIHFNNLLELTKAFLDSLNIRHELSSVQASGYLFADAKFRTNFKKLKSEGKIIIKDASFINSLYNLGINGINLNMLLDNNALQITDTEATVNNSKITASGYIDNDANTSINIDINNLNLPSLYMAFAPKELKGQIKLQSANISSHVALLGKLEKLSADVSAVLSNLSVSDNFKTMLALNNSLSLRIKANSEKIKANIKNKNFKFSLPQMNTTATIDDINVDIDNSVITIKPFNVVYNNSSSISVYGDIENYLESPTMDVFADGEIKTQDLATTLSDAKYFVPHKGKIPLKVSIQGNPRKQKITAQIYADSENYISPITINSLENHPSLIQIITEIKGNDIRIKNAGLFKKASKGLSDILENNMQNAVQIADIKAIIYKNHINLFRFTLPNEITGKISIFPKSKFNCQGRITMNGSTLSPHFGGNLKIHDLNIPEILLNIKNIDLDMLNQAFKLSINDINANSSILQTSLKGSLVPSSIFKIYDFDLYSAFVDVDKALIVSEKLTKYMPPSNASSNSSSGNIPLYVQGKINLDKITTGAITINDIKSKLFVQDNKLILQDMKCKAFEGSINGDIAMNLLTSLLEIDVKGKNINLDNMMVSAANMKDTLSGRGDFWAKLSLKGATYLEQVKSLKGNLKFSFKNGTYGPFSKLENFFIAQNIRENPIFKNTIGVILTPILTIDSSHYEVLEGNLNFKDGIVNIKPITSQGDILCVLILGNMNLIDNTINSKVRVRLASVVSDLLGPLAMANPVNLIKNTPGLNIATAKLFSIFSIVVTENEYKQIPDFSSKHTDKNATKFQIILNGDVAKPLKLVKSFKWLALQSDMDKAKKFSEEFIAQQEELARQAEMKRLQEEYEKTHKTKPFVKKIFSIDNPAPAVKEMQLQKINIKP